MIVCAYRSRHRIDNALGSLRRQDLEEPWEVIVVDSGDDDAAGYVARAYPEVKSRALRAPALSGRRSQCRSPGGPRATSSPSSPTTAWPSIGFGDGSSDTERATPPSAARSPTGLRGTPVGTASSPSSTRRFCLASASSPNRRSLTASPQRELVQQLGGFPEDLKTGEDTVLNARLIERVPRSNSTPRSAWRT